MALDHSTQVQRAPLRERRGDCYDTPDVAVHALLKAESEFFRHHCVIWEPACGTGNIVAVLRDAGHEVFATDLNDRGCPNSLARWDFLLPGSPLECCDAIVTNPPFALAEEFVELALERAPLVIMLLRLAFYESDRRTDILEKHGLVRIHCFRKRLPMMHRAGWRVARPIPGWHSLGSSGTGIALASRLSSTGSHGSLRWIVGITREARSVATRSVHRPLAPERSEAGQGSTDANRARKLVEVVQARRRHHVSRAERRRA